MKTQLNLFTTPATATDVAVRNDLILQSSDGTTATDARVALEQRYANLLILTKDFNRRLVSYQASRKTALHQWFKYKEGFSAQLVNALLEQFGVAQGSHILDPFAGSATTLLVAKQRGVNATGIELLPHCHLAWETKSRSENYDIDEIKLVLKDLILTQPHAIGRRFPHVAITESAFPTQYESELMWYAQWLNDLSASDLTKQLLKFVLMGILEEVSYTRKDGQYLRWDYRSEKIKKNNERRRFSGKPEYKRFDKGRISNPKQSIIVAITTIIKDLTMLQRAKVDATSEQALLKGSALEILPTLKDQAFDAIITSPPYCNRYDYTRTYALELAYLGLGETEIKRLRQEMLSCTVESRSKQARLAGYYASTGAQDRYEEVMGALTENAVFKEINHALRQREERGELNNAGVPRMVEGYFTEMAFVIREMYRVTKPGGRVAIVNDNVRYGGEIIPVDLLSTNLAESFGFIPEVVYVLQQKKGNSSQQMGRYGRAANRKSITIWMRP
jgi:DNA modification methylase